MKQMIDSIGDNISLLIKFVSKGSIFAYNDTPFRTLYFEEKIDTTLVF